MPELGVNIDHVATIRQARKIDYPDPVEAALICQDSGADSIVCHLREDRRHIQDEDLYRMRKKIGVKLNLEMAMSEEIIKIALDVAPDQITLVPERRMELTTEGGLDVATHIRRVEKIARRMVRAGIRVSLFVDPRKSQVKASRDAGVFTIELHTGCYANAKNKKSSKREYDAIKQCADYAEKNGLRVFAGHGLNYSNVKPLTKIRVIEEYNIGHSIVARSIFTGLGKAVREMKALIR
ncbi:MAG: pyridoxine 5'-phosphate synthase [Candidatus Omnitrophica bacterium]|nr:pyridoxine 5'-phosphate synthase [Candidatus Omnitrophota bacterium]